MYERLFIHETLTEIMCDADDIQFRLNRPIGRTHASNQFVDEEKGEQSLLKRIDLLKMAANYVSRLTKEAGAQEEAAQLLVRVSRVNTAVLRVVAAVESVESAQARAVQRDRARRKERITQQVNQAVLAELSWQWQTGSRKGRAIYGNNGCEGRDSQDDTCLGDVVDVQSR